MSFKVARFAYMLSDKYLNDSNWFLKSETSAHSFPSCDECTTVLKMSFQCFNWIMFAFVSQAAPGVSKVENKRFRFI